MIQAFQHQKYPLAVLLLTITNLHLGRLCGIGFRFFSIKQVETQELTFLLLALVVLPLCMAFTLLKWAMRASPHFGHGIGLFLGGWVFVAMVFQMLDRLVNSFYPLTKDDYSTIYQIIEPLGPLSWLMPFSLLALWRWSLSRGRRT